MGVGIAELRESLSEYAAGFDAAVLSAAQAAEVVEQASRIEKMAATVKGLAAARVAETGSWRTEGDRSAAHQLARRTGTSVVQAAAAIDTARRLEALPETVGRRPSGRVVGRAGVRHRRRRGADTAAEHDLLETARRSPLAELREQCARTKATASVDLEARRRRIHQRRSLRSFTDAEGEWHLHCRNNPEVGARIMAALDPFREEIFRQARSEGRTSPPTPTPPTPWPRWPAARATARAGADRCCGRPRRPGRAADADGADATAGADAVDRRDGAADSGPSASERGCRRCRDRRTGGTAGPAGRRRSRSRRARARRSRPAVTPKIIVRIDLGALLRGCPSRARCARSPGSGRWRCPRCGT